MSTHKGSKFDVAIVGGGFYGCILALYLRNYHKNVILIEKENDLLTKASYNNQARVHNGYHYPRSFLTALRSHLNYSQFISDYKNSIYDKFLMVYAIASHNSKITSQRFKKFCEQIGSPIKPAPFNLKKWFNPKLVEEVFVVEEVAFDAARLRDSLKEKLEKAKVKILYQSEVIKISKAPLDQIAVYLKNGGKIISHRVFNCTYSRINQILKNSNLPLLPLKHEMTEMPLIKMPKELKKFGLIILDGPFFSTMPFPDKKMHSLHHVRYTPHYSWTDGDSYKRDYSKLWQFPKNSNFLYMIKDAQRYIPLLKEVKYIDSLYEVKTVLIQNEIDDGRPILYRKDYGLKNFYVIMGGKIDNIYDIIHELQK